VIPPVAQDFHRKNIDSVVNTCFERANIDPSELDAIAVTTRPGLALSLQIGVRYARYLSRKHNKPLIPVHHMQAHAITARMENDQIEFPFLTLLISGAHCLLAFVKDVDEWILLGESVGKLFIN
jgi:N6-L-threonylcarbamoyladenine synthase